MSEDAAMAANEDIPATPQRLAEVGVNISTLFDRLKHVDDRQLQLESGSSTTLEHEAERFELWAVNLGLHHFGHSSLDYRLREVDLLHDAFRALLVDLRRTLIQISDTNAFGNFPTTTATGTYGARSTAGEAAESVLTKYEQQELVDDYGSDSDEDQESHYALLVRDVSDIIDRLYKISTKIRTSSTRLRSSKTLKYREVNEDTKVDLIEEFRRIDALHLRELFRHYQRSATVDIESFLQARLSTANTRRRQQFGHWRQHHQKMTQISSQEKQNIAPARTSSTPLLNQLNNAPKQMNPMNVAQVVIGPSVTSATHLTATRIRVDDQSSVISVSTYAGSETGMDEAQDFPEPPKSFHGLKYFQCPYCYTLCSSGHLEKRAWRSHLIHDLRPYVCTYERCELGHVMYDCRQDWVEHESSTHRKSWRCLKHRDQTFASISAYGKHLHEPHANDADVQLDDLLRAGETIASSPERPCPFCFSTFDNNNTMERHVAKHLERIARFALPKSTGLEDDKDDMGNSSGQVEGTRVSYSSLSAFSNDSSTDIETREPSHVITRAQPVSSDAIQHYQEAAELPIDSRVHKFLTDLQQFPIQRDEGETAVAADSRLGNRPFSHGLDLSLAPFFPRENLVGREAELEELARLLLPGVSRQVVAVVGVGGTGKTRLVHAFANRQSERYSSIFWLNADNEGTLRRDLAGLAERVLHLNAYFMASQDEGQVVRELMKWFSIPGNNQWLLIFDDYVPGREGPHDFDLRRYFPARDQGSILITTRFSGLEFAMDMQLGGLLDPNVLLEDEYILRETDAEGEKKVDSLGYLQGGREYKIRTFALPGRGKKLFMLAAECARVLAYRDSYLLFNKNRSLHKILASQEEKEYLIQQDHLPYSHGSRQIAIVTARSMFRQFGSRVIQQGRRVRDDYWEAKARKQGYTEDFAEATEIPNRDGLDDIWIAVVTHHGEGNTSFIKVLTQRDYIFLSDRFELDMWSLGGPDMLVYEFVHKNRKIHLVEIPEFIGFPDSGLKFLRKYARWLLEKYRANIRLSGLLYLQRIDDGKMSTDNIALRCLRVVKKLCGEDNFNSIILVSTGWKSIDKETGILRENDLMETPQYWGDLIEKGSMVMRHDGSRESALHIISNIIGREEHFVLEIQREMDMGMAFENTAAGRFLQDDTNSWLQQRRKEQEEEEDERLISVRGIFDPVDMAYQDSESEEEGEGLDDRKPEGSHLEESEAQLEPIRDDRKPPKTDRMNPSSQSRNSETAKQTQQQEEEHQETALGDSELDKPHRQQLARYLKEAHRDEPYTAGAAPRARDAALLGELDDIMLKFPTGQGASERSDQL